MSKFEVTIKPDQEFITLQAVLQVTGFINTGGMAKVFLSDNVVLVNGEEENRRGRKLYPDDEVQIHGQKILIKK